MNHQQTVQRLANELAEKQGEDPEADLKAAVVAIGRIKDINQLRLVNEALKSAFDHANRKVTRNLSVGDRVMWDGKWGNREKGVVVKINNKSVKIKADSGVNWTVSPSLLKPEV